MVIVCSVGCCYAEMLLVEILGYLLVVNAC